MFCYNVVMSSERSRKPRSVETMLEDLRNALQEGSANTRAAADMVERIQETYKQERRTNRSVMDALADLGVFRKNYSTGENHPNAVWQMVGHDPSRMTGDAWLELVHPDDQHLLLQEATKGTVKESAGSAREYRIRDSAGRWRWLLSNGRVATWTENNEPEWFVGVDHEITHRKRLEEQLANAKDAGLRRAEEAETLLTAAAAVTSTLDRDHAISRVLEQARRVVPYERAAVLLVDSDLIHMVGADGFNGANSALPNNVPMDSEPVNCRVLSGAILHSRSAEEVGFPDNRLGTDSLGGWLAVPLRFHEGIIGMLTFSTYEEGGFTARHQRLASAFADYVAIAIEHARTYAKAAELAATDSLTGAATRREFFREAERLIRTHGRTGRPLSVLMLDLDHFKRVNDEQGHAAGDEVLRRIVRLLNRELRGGDLLCRYGGEEFAILLAESDADSAHSVAERLRSVIHSESAAMGTVTASIGVASVPVDDGSGALQNAITAADEALYEAKNLGRNRVILAAGSRA